MSVTDEDLNGTDLDLSKYVRREAKDGCMEWITHLQPTWTSKQVVVTECTWCAKTTRVFVTCV